MNIMLIDVPSRKATIMLPLGLLNVGGIIERCGHKAKIIDAYLVDKERLHVNFINKMIEDFKPDIVGFGGIATSYRRTKELSLHIKDRYPNILQIAGGPLASTYELLLTKARVDVVFHGETEINLPEFLECLEHGKAFHNVPGISFLSNGEVVRNNPPEQIKNLDEIPFPAYHLVDLNRYLSSIKDFLAAYSFQLRTPQYAPIIKKIGDRTKYIPIVTSRGCTHRCLFCYRHDRGHRQHSVNYVIEHIKYLQKTYGIFGFEFVDELFNRDVMWVMEFCDAIERENLDIFYMVDGARVDRVDEKMLHRLKQTGCIEINYGQESGSDTILRELGKGVTGQQNKEITKLTQQVGMFTTVPLVIGSPSETNKTIDETIQFLKDTDTHVISLNYMIPLPETPIWQYVMKKKLIADVERYLDDVAELGGMPLVNLTSVPDYQWRRWNERILYEHIKHYYKTTGRLWLYSLYSVGGKMRMYFGPFIPRSTKEKIGRLLRQFNLKI